jgi:hypothetical protein
MAIFMANAKKIKEKKDIEDLRKVEEAAAKLKKDKYDAKMALFMKNA